MSSIRGMLSQKASAASNGEFHRYVVSSGPILKAVLSTSSPEELPAICASVVHVLWSLHLDRLIVAPLARTCIQQDLPATFPAGGLEALRDDSVNSRLLNEYLRVHGFDFLKKILSEPLQKIASGRYNEELKKGNATVPINDILNGMLALERDFPGPVHECLMNAFHHGESQGGKGTKAVNFIYLVLFIYPMMRNPQLLGISNVGADYQEKVARIVETWLQVLAQEAPASPKVSAWAAVLSAHSVEEDLALCARRQKRFFEGLLQRLAKIDREKKKRPLSPEHLATMTSFCRKNEEQVCRALHALDFGEICVYQFRVLLAAEPSEAEARVSKKKEPKKESVAKLFEPIEASPSSTKERDHAILHGWAQRWTQEKQTWRKCYVVLNASVLRFQETEASSDRDRTVTISSIYEVREAADDFRLIIGCSGGRKEYMLKFADKAALYLWKANLGETRRVLSTELTPSILVDPNDIELGSAIARGGEGTIYKGLFRGTVHAAIKTIQAYSVDARGTHTEKFPKDILILGQLDHPNVLPLLGYARRPEEFLIVTPWIDLGNLSDLLAKDRSPFTETLISAFGYEIASGMAHIHSRGLLHRDLKTQNLLVKSLDPAAPVHVLIADFGTARSLDEEEVFTKNPGTLVYEAPETHSGVYDEKVDVYSFGMCIWEMYSGQLPWAGERWTAQILQKVINGERPPFPESCPDTSRRIITACWNTDPKERPAFSALVFKDPKYLEAAERAAAVVWRQGLAKKGVGLCHGVSGNGYLMLRSELNLARVLASRLVAKAEGAESPSRAATASPHRSINSSTSSSLEGDGVLYASYGPPASKTPAAAPQASPKAALKSWSALLQAAGFEPGVVELYSKNWAPVPMPKSFADIPFDELKEIEGTRVSHLKALRKWVKTQQP